ncbi:MAG: MoaD/ThiS family protein [Erythrobacter sp.]|uniref:MoaD/ThiS family protein n=1 Tax=Erythrobacter sp. TaxID=1042 RepID=UPI003267FAE6
MAVRIIFLGPLADMAGKQSVEADAPLDWAGLLDVVGKEVAAQLGEERVNVAFGGRVLADKTQLRAKDGDEVALLPPVSGG